jgi:hypothetical protein
MSEFNYKDKTAPKLTEEFKQKFTVNIKGKDAIKVEGLLAFAHEKGIKRMVTDLIQFPNKDNNWTAICKTIVIGYDWDPINDKLCEVEFSDIADANENNCTSMVKASYIRMASTRSIGRALRKYTNIDMVCSAELSDVVEDAPEQQAPSITTEMLNTVKELVQTKGLDKNAFATMLFGLFQSTNYMALTVPQGNVLIASLSALPERPAPQPNGNPS